MAVGQSIYLLRGAPRADYRTRLRRRVVGAALFSMLTLLVTLFALRTVTGQGVDTLMMESISLRFSSLQSWRGVSTGLVSGLNLVVASVVVAGVAIVRGRRHLAGRAIAIIALSNLVVQALKWVIVRPDLGLTAALPNSLPSGHVTVAASLAVAMVVVSPDYLRSMAAWIGWAWTACMGVAVIVQSWHRVSDVVVSVMIVGVCALLLSPIESQQRHFPSGHTVMAVLVSVAFVGAMVLTVAGLWGMNISAAGQVSSEGYGFTEYLREYPTRSVLLACAGSLWVSGMSGLVIHEVDRLRWPLTRP